MPRHLELRRQQRAAVAADADLGEMRGAHLRLLEQRRDQAIGAVAVLHAFAHGVDAGIERLQRVVDHYAAVATQAGLAGKIDVRPDAGGHDDEIRVEVAAILQTARRLRGQRSVIANRPGGHAELDAAPLHDCFSRAAARPVELAFHQRVKDVHDRHIHALLEQAARGFEPEQSAADHDRLALCTRGLKHGVDVLQVAERDDAGQIAAGNRQTIGFEPVASNRRSYGASMPLREMATRRRRSIATTGSPVCSVMPCSRYHASGLRMMSSTFFSPASSGREQDAVVVGMRLRAEDGDVVGLGRNREQLLDDLHTRHAIADDDELTLVPSLARSGTLFTQMRPSATRAG